MEPILNIIETEKWGAHFKKHKESLILTFRKKDSRTDFSEEERGNRINKKRIGGKII